MLVSMTSGLTDEEKRNVRRRVMVRTEVSRMHCWLFRYEALGFEFWWQAPVPDDLDCAEWGCDLSPGGGAWDHNCVHGYLTSMCGLPDGHTGDHQFVRQDAITLVFAEVPHVA